MRWYNQLYVGKKAKKRRFRMIQNIRSRKMQPDTYVITPAENGNNILDIYPSIVLLQPYYEEKDCLILGIAYGYREALLVARDIVDDMFQQTGGLDLQDFLNRNERQGV